MPKSKEQNFRLRLIDETLRNRKFVKTADLVKLIKNQLGEDVSDRANTYKGIIPADRCGVFGIEVIILNWLKQSG